MAREQHNEGEVEERRDNMTLDERIKVVGEQVALVKQLGPDKYLTVYPHQAEELLEYLTELAHRRAADERREAVLRGLREVYESYKDTYARQMSAKERKAYAVAQQAIAEWEAQDNG